MTLKVGINGYGRIGRNILRALYESGKREQLQIVAINDLGDAKINAHLTRYDTVHGRFAGEVKNDGDSMVVNGDRIKVLTERDPGKLPWGSLGVDTVFECTGLFTSKAKASKHLEGGAKRVVKVLHDKIGVVNGIMTTIHSYTNDQVLTDVYHSDLRRARSATQSMIPTKTGAASATGLVLPELKGKLDGYSIRVPTINVSLVDLTFNAKRATTVEEVNKAIQEAAGGFLKGVLAYSDAPLVSSDFNHDPHSSIFDATLTKIIDGTMVKVFSWYDNEWGFSNRMIDTTLAWAQAK